MGASTTTLAASVLFSLGGIEPSFALIEQVDPKRLEFVGESTTIVYVVSLLAWGLGYMGQPHILARFMAAESVQAIAPARRISMTWMILCLVGAMLIGFFGIAWHPMQSSLVKMNPESLRAMVTNYDELADAVSRSEFAELLDPEPGEEAACASR